MKLGREVVKFGEGSRDLQLEVQNVPMQYKGKVNLIPCIKCSARKEMGGKPYQHSLVLKE